MTSTIDEALLNKPRITQACRYRDSPDSKVVRSGLAGQGFILSKSREFFLYHHILSLSGVVKAGGV